jgi:hypothetical protein
MRAKNADMGAGVPNETIEDNESHKPDDNIFSDFAHLAKEDHEASKLAQREQWRGQYSSPRSARQHRRPHNSLSSSLSGSFTGSLPGKSNASVHTLNPDVIC